MPFQIIREDITKVKADAIVHTENFAAAIEEGVELIESVCGGQFQYTIHVSPPQWVGGTNGEHELLRLCYDKCLKIAKDNKLGSIAFPILAINTYRFPKEVSVQIAIDVFTAFLENHEMDIMLVAPSDEATSISGELLYEVINFLEGLVYNKPTVCESPPFRVQALKEAPCAYGAGLYEESCVLTKTLDERLKDIYTDSLEKHLKTLIRRKGLKNSEVYAAANVSKQYFSKLLKGQIKPSKGKMLALAVGLRLDIDELADFLRIAGYALSPISQTDAVVEYFIQKKDYNVIKIDIVLFDYGLEPLSSL